MPNLFHFKLAPIETISPWGREGHLSLHWFGLTQGWFWIDADGQELFRYTDEIQAYWAKHYPESGLPVLPYVDYPITRHWEDLIDTCAEVLDPLPDDFAARVADAEGWQRWQDAAVCWQNESSDEITSEVRSEVYFRAVLWWCDHQWAVHYLNAGPRIWLWRIGDAVHLRWDNRAITINGIPVWQATVGEITLPAAVFLDALQSFDKRFLAAMQERVESVRASRSHSEIMIDVAALEAEQSERTERIEDAFRPPSRAYSWDEVREAIAIIERG